MQSRSDLFEDNANEMPDLIVPLNTLRPHAHQTRREKRSKLGPENPIVVTGLFTLQATSNA